MLAISGLHISFTRYGAWLSRHTIHPVQRLDLQVAPGEVVAVVGESGSGKSLLAHAVLGLLPSNATVGGEILFKGQSITPKQARLLRGRKIALIPQSVGFLNPLLRIGRQVEQAAHLSGLDRPSARQAREKAFSRYSLPRETTRLFPFQLSGGMARRALTATATAGQAELIIADEPTTGLDGAVLADALSHLRQLADEGRGVVIITHDIAAALQVADKVAVFHAGMTLEMVDAKVFTETNQTAGPRHPYTRALWRSLPGREFTDWPGMADFSSNGSAGCCFAEKCSRSSTDCTCSVPVLRQWENGWVRCHNA